MRTPWSLGHRCLVRFLVELQSETSGAVHGTVTPEGRPPSAFSGWLDLVRHLEERTDTTNTQEGQQP